MKILNLKKLKKDIKPGLLLYFEKKDPGKSLSTYSTYVSDSNYLLNNNREHEFITFVRSDEDMPEIKELIRSLLIEHRGTEKVTESGVSYYYEKLCWQREYIQSIGGIEQFTDNKE